MNDLINIKALNEMIQSAVSAAVTEETRALAAEIEMLKKSKAVKEVLTAREAAEYMGLSIHYIRDKVVPQRLIPYSKVSNRLYFRTEDLNNYILGKMASSQEQINAKADALMMKNQRRKRNHN